METIRMNVHSQEYMETMARLMSEALESPEGMRALDAAIAGQEKIEPDVKTQVQDMRAQAEKLCTAGNEDEAEDGHSHKRSLHTSPYLGRRRVSRRPQRTPGRGPGSLLTADYTRGSLPGSDGGMKNP